MSTPHIDRPTLFRVAAEADTDPRTVLAEVAAERGERPHVRGRVGERVRAALAALRLLAPPSTPHGEARQ